jgi:monoamine oxidase
MRRRDFLKQTAVAAATLSTSHVARPEGRIHFAGEHDSVWIDGWMQGALESGNRVAREVNDAV